MKATTALAVAAAFLFTLAGCAGMQPQTSLAGSTASTPGSGAHYCWQERLNDLGPDLVCNWSTLSDACSAKDLVSLPKTSVVGEPRKTHRCENGQWLVMVNSR
jgi:hypothetical protein